MLNQLNIKINNFGSIANADIDIGKINIVGGFNSTGKSTCSKILYSLLRANSKTRKRLSDTSLVNEILKLAIEFHNFCRSALDEDQDDEEIRDQITDIIDEMTSKMRDNVKPEDFEGLKYFERLNEIYEGVKIKVDYQKIVDNSFSKIQELVDIYNEDGDELFKSLFKQLVRGEFGKNVKELQDVSLSGKYNNQSFDYKINISNSDFDISGWFIVEDVFYFDSLSPFDFVSRGGLQHTNHIRYLLQSLDDDESS